MTGRTALASVWLVFASAPVLGEGVDCGLPGAAFCESFERGISSVASRSGDLDPERMTGGRQTGEGGRGPNYIDRSDIPACRAGSVTNPLPPGDALVCDPIASRNSRHALIAATAQNYGDIQFRVDQPFDFAGRTGKIRMDVSLYGSSGNASPQVVLSEQPPAVASINDENGKGTALGNGFIIQFRLNCVANRVGQLVRLYKNYAESILADQYAGNNLCSARNTVRTSPGRMNRVELRISKVKLEIWATDFSADGISFESLRRVFSSVPVDLPFTRGWYSFGGHNHATRKYEGRTSHITYWDNIAFDGPVVVAPTVYQIPDNTQPDGAGRDLGWPFHNRARPTMAPLTFRNVEAGGISSAKLVFNVYIDAYNSFFGRKTYYRLNGGSWHRYRVPQGILNNVSNFAHRTMFALDVDTAELIDGDNTVQFSSDDLWNGVATYVSNVDLLVWR